MHKQWRDEITLPTSASIHVNYQNPWALFPADLKEKSQAAGMYPDPSGTLWDSSPALCAHFCADITSELVTLGFLHRAAAAAGAQLPWGRCTSEMGHQNHMVQVPVPVISLQGAPGDLLSCAKRGAWSHIPAASTGERAGIWSSSETCPGKEGPMEEQSAWGLNTAVVIGWSTSGSGLQSSTGGHCKASCALCGELGDS